jgi:DNA-binding SARP family transcriptional activator
VNAAQPPEFLLLGPLEVWRDGVPIALGAPKQQALLAVLLLNRGEVLSSDRLIDELWGERAPAAAAKSVQVYVSGLRKALGAETRLHARRRPLARRPGALRRRGRARQGAARRG